VKRKAFPIRTYLLFGGIVERSKGSGLAAAVEGDGKLLTVRREHAANDVVIFGIRTSHFVLSWEYK
jgi:hypothetical protein